MAKCNAFNDESLILRESPSNESATVSSCDTLAVTLHWKENMEMDRNHWVTIRVEITMIIELIQVIIARRVQKRPS